ncbi:MAG TPA: hypothetical protein VGG72_06050 [Bryobacteraceae bacterium]
MGKGTGLGLATIFGVIEQNGCDIMSIAKLGSGPFSAFICRP